MEYVVTLFLIGAAAAGPTWKFCGEVRDIFLERAESLSGNGEESSPDLGNEDANPLTEGGEDDGYGPKDRDPGGGVVDASDVANGCPFTAGSEYYRAKRATQLQSWSWVILDPEDHTEPMWGNRGRPWFASTPTIFILLKSDFAIGFQGVSRSGLDHQHAVWTSPAGGGHS
ncbi:hypothetical protein [Alloyangia pacifica]|uniref:hypothetical protein n=1 Tax=Alloyangia pacifica TaxID=311180 RepID=UPI001CFD77B1|nr:hypothetical protein [Alloyangia pacifica]